MIMRLAKGAAYLVIGIMVLVQLVLWVPAQIYIFVSTWRVMAQNVIVGLNMPDLPNSRQQARAGWRQVRKGRRPVHRIH